MPSCPRCSRPNPPGALFCRYDGHPLDKAAESAPLPAAPVWQPVQVPAVTEPPPLPPPPPTPAKSASWLLVPVLLVVTLGVGALVMAMALPSREPPTTASAPPQEPMSPPRTEANARIEGGNTERPAAPTTVAGMSHAPGPIDARPRHLERPTDPPALLLPDFQTREVEVVFCLDTTGSMGSLLQGAKQKIWWMCSQIAGGKPTPQLQVGLVAYKDRGDVYVTKVTELTRDLDHVHAELQALTADGGGDAPESVNQALDDAVNRIRWSKDRKTLKIIFLVGDAPPHMDYKDDVKYPVTCQKAFENNILINAIQCGSDSECRVAWKDIAAKANGQYVAIPQRGGVVTLTSPHDEGLAKLGRRLLDTALLYGDEKRVRQAERTLAEARRLKGVAAADRSAYAAKSKRIVPHDLLDDLKSRRVKLEDVPEDELPSAMQDLTKPEEQRGHLAKVEERREAIYQEILTLEKKRAAFLRDAMAKRNAGRDAFDTQVLEMLRKQAKRFEIDY